MRFPRKKKNNKQKKSSKLRKRQIMNIWSQTGMNQLIGLMIWDWKRRRLEVFTVMVLTSLLQSNVKVSFQLFKETIQLLKLNLVQVKQVLSPLLPFRLLIQLPTTFKLWLCHQQESFLSRSLSLSTLSVNIKELKFTLVSVEPVLEMISIFSKKEASILLLVLQEESTIWWRRTSSRPTTSDSLSWTRQMKCSPEVSRLRSKISSSSYPEMSRSLFSPLPCQTRSSVSQSISWETQRRFSSRVRILPSKVSVSTILLSRKRNGRWRFSSISIPTSISIKLWFTATPKREFWS